MTSDPRPGQKWRGPDGQERHVDWVDGPEWGLVRLVGWDSNTPIAGDCTMDEWTRWAANATLIEDPASAGEETP